MRGRKEIIDVPRINEEVRYSAIIGNLGLEHHNMNNFIIKSEKNVLPSITFREFH